MPLFSIVTPVYRTPLEYLEACIASVEAQTFGDWELLLVDNGNPDDLSDWLRRRVAAEARIRIVRTPVNLGITGGSRLGVDAAAGEFIALLDHDDTLSPLALSRMAEAIARTPDADYLYSDEDKIIGRDPWVYGEPFFKPDWSPERFRHQMYTCHFSVLRASLVREVGGFCDGYEGSQDYDLVLRVTEKARSVVHVPEILYHWRAHEGSTARASEQKPFAQEAARKAVQEHCERLGIAAEVCDGPHPGVYRVRRRLAGRPLVSFLLPTSRRTASIRGEVVPLVLHFVESVEERTTYENFEYVLCYDSTEMDPALLAEVERRCSRPLTLVEYVQPAEGFNFSTTVNRTAARARGEYLIVLNDDLEVITPDWVEELLGHAQDPTVGAVGGLYYFEDETVQHAGVACAAGPAHLFRGLPRGSSPPGSHLAVARECSVLTGACLAVRREAFFAVGGFTEELPNNFNDVDFCLKLASLGLRNIWTPFVEMYHFESKSRDNTVRSHEIDWLAERWGRQLWRDPFYNPNLKGIAPRWDHFDDWDRVTRDWALVVTRASQIELPLYLELNPDLAATRERDPDWDVIEHFRMFGRYEQRRQAVKRERHPADRNSLRRVPATREGFDRTGYLLANPDLRAIAAADPAWDPYEHLVAHGLAEGRQMYLCSSAEDGRSDADERADSGALAA